MPMNSGNEPFTEYAILEEIVTQLRTISDLNANNCFISAEPVFMGGTWPGDQYVQVSPGVSLDQHSQAGSGYRKSEVRVSIWKRLLVDAAYQDTEKVVDATNGIMVLSETIHNKLTQNFLKARLVIPLRPKRREPGSQLPANHTGWTRVDRLYDYTHRETFSAQSNDTS